MSTLRVAKGRAFHWAEMYCYNCDADDNKLPKLELNSLLPISLPFIHSEWRSLYFMVRKRKGQQLTVALTSLSVRQRYRLSFY